MNLLPREMRAALDIGQKSLTRQMHSDGKKRRSSFLVALLFATGDPHRSLMKLKYKF
jgi:hypothetical protein